MGPSILPTPGSPAVAHLHLPLQDLEFRQLVERVKLRTPIEAVVGDRVADLRKRGALLWACCPFHDERTPSFSVDPRRGTWRCFGACGEGGDVFSFLQRFDGLTFSDALRLLAEACGEEMPDLSSRPRSTREEKRLEERLETMARAARLYRRLLGEPGGRRALDYAHGRGFTDETLETFGVGWAPDHGNPLLEAATSVGVSLDLLVEVGLVRRAEDGRPFDFFHGRLLVPIRDRVGRVVAFGGRHLPGDERARGKYVNTPETPLFHKGSLIFGLDLAAEGVRRSKHLVLMEGYTDVMAAHQAGFPNTGAVLGTATTEDHAALVRRSGAQRITLVFDGDEAGRRASERALAGLLSLGRTIDVVSPPSGRDPADLLLGGPEGEFAALVEGARDWFAWTIDGLAGRGGPELAEGVDRMFELLAHLPKPVERETRLKELAAALELSLDGILEQWRAFRGRRARFTPRSPETAPALPEDPSGPDDAALPDESPPPADPRVESAFRSLVGALLLDNSLIPLYGELVTRCPGGDIRTIFEAVLHLYEHGDEDQPVDSAAVMSRLADHPARDEVVRLEIQAGTAESPLALARDQELWLARRAHERELEALRAQLRRPRSENGDEETASGLLKSLHEQLRKRRVPTPTPTVDR